MIVGAGDVGRYVAFILSKQEHNIILIDQNKRELEAAAWHMDIATRVGSGTDWQLLDDLLEFSPHFFIALTNDDETNLVACSLAKHLGYPRTIARVRGDRYLNRARLDVSRIFAVDYFIAPELLAADNILKIIMSSGSLALESFAHGSVEMRTLSVPPTWPHGDKPLKKVELPEGIMVGLIYREKKSALSTNRNMAEDAAQLIFPHGNDHILPYDEVTLIGETDAILKIHRFFGVIQKEVKSVIIIGGSLTAWNLARLLGHLQIDVRIIEKDYDRCIRLAEQLPGITIMHHDAADYEFLLSERVAETDIVVTCTESDEANLLTAMLAKEAGCLEAIVMLSNRSYLSIVDNLGLKHIVSPRISAANHIMSQMLFGKVTSLVSLYDNRAEIMEISISQESNIAGIPLSELGPLLPKNFLVAMIQNRGRIMIARGDRVISPGDTIIAISDPKHIEELEKNF